ncbi:MAG: PASTA domain-containing protein [Aureispira sp.]
MANKISTFFGDLWRLRKFLITNLLGVIVVTFVLIQLALWGISWYTLHGESIEVPNMVNMSLEEAEKLLATRKLDFEVVDSVCKGQADGGIIREQNPKPAQRVKESRKIYLIVTKHDKCTVKVYYDQLIGRSRKQVVRFLRRSNLKVGKLTYRPGGKAENTVVEAAVNGAPLFVEVNPTKGENKPVEGRPVPQGSIVDLVLLEGMDALPQRVPDLLCDTYGAAEFAIKGSQFNLGQVHLDGNIVDTLDAWVWKQRPSANAKVNMGSGIQVWLTSEYPAACEEDILPLPVPDDNPVQYEVNESER